MEPVPLKPYSASSLADKLMAGDLLLLLAALLLAMPAFGQAEDSLPGYSQYGAEQCLWCHAGAADAHLMDLFQGPHAVRGDPRSPFGAEQLQCEACHGPGGDHAGPIVAGRERPAMPAFGPNALWSNDRQNEMCTACHLEQGHRFWDGSEHQRAELSCADCHESHARRDPMNLATSQNAVCMDCHITQRSQSQRAYAHPVRHGEMACSDCHAAHGSINDAMLTDLNINQNCYTCHADKRGPHLWEHAPVAEDCTHCHQPHGSNHPGMLTRRAPLLCQSCHGRESHVGIGITGDGLPDNNPSNLLLLDSCMNCHTQVHGSNHPSGRALAR
ncbi:MAG: DmsE family decaheme c-type cytochrome [Wenzhouxiangella sp.]|nr:MAG: DmsE family decaheme c-type cytochrome [Wenzhouxiangella sp.]